MKFDKQTHTYTKDGIKYTSVTSLLSLYGLAPDYSFVDSDVLNSAAQRGRTIHSELEKYVKGDKKVLTYSLEAYLLSLYIEAHELKMSKFLVEEMVYMDEYRVAGMVDLIYKNKENLLFIDHKTGSTVDKVYFAWQLSLYNFLYVKGNKDLYIKNDIIVLQYKRNGFIKERKYKLIDYDLVKELLDNHIESSIE